jgi:hypothetical protein
VRATLFLERVEELWKRPAAHDISELPRKVMRVPNPGIEALPTKRRHDMRGVSGEQDAPATIRIGDSRVNRIDGCAANFDVRGSPTQTQNRAEVPGLQEAVLGLVAA